MTDREIDYRTLDRTSGWVVFSGTVIGVAAALHLIFAVTVLANPDWVVLTPGALIRFDLTTVGLTYLVLAAIQFFVSLGVFRGASWARVFGVVGASISALTHTAFMSVYPAWAWVLLATDVLVIYGLAVHGDEIAEL
jgi:hypothetical protein